MSARSHSTEPRTRPRLDTAPLREFTARFATAEEIENWDKHVTANPNGGNMLQSAAYASVKNGSGWKVRFLVLEIGGDRQLQPGAGEELPAAGPPLVPHQGPGLGAAEDLPAALEACAALRAQPEAQRLHHQGGAGHRGTPRGPGAPGCRRPGQGPQHPVQRLHRPAGHLRDRRTSASRPSPPAPATPSAARSGKAAKWSAREAGPETYRALYDLMADTVKAKGSMPLRSYEYYARFWDEFCNRGQGSFFFVYEDGKPSVGAFVINYGAKATYKDGGSTQNRKQYGDSHLVQWAAIRQHAGAGLHGVRLLRHPARRPDQGQDPQPPRHGDVQNQLHQNSHRLRGLPRLRPVAAAAPALGQRAERSSAASKPPAPASSSTDAQLRQPAPATSTTGRRCPPLRQRIHR